MAVKSRLYRFDGPVNQKDGTTILKTKWGVVTIGDTIRLPESAITEWQGAFRFRLVGHNQNSRGEV